MELLVIRHRRVPSRAIMADGSMFLCRALDSRSAFNYVAIAKPNVAMTLAVARLSLAGLRFHFLKW